MRDAGGGGPDLPREAIGRILIRRRLVSSEQLDEALKEQRESGGRVGEILVRRGLVGELDVVVALMVQCGVPYINVERHVPDPGTRALVPASVARRYHVVPLARVGTVLSVVMVDPLDPEALDALREASGLWLAPFISTRSQVLDAVRRIYGEGDSG